MGLICTPLWGDRAEQGALFPPGTGALGSKSQDAFSSITPRHLDKKFIRDLALNRVLYVK